MMDYNCSNLLYHNITAPNVEGQLEALGVYGFVVTLCGTVFTVFLIGLFLLNVLNIINKQPAPRRRLLAWITSLPMVACFLSLVTILVPRSGEMCDTVKHAYIPFLLMHFVDLSLQLEGGEAGALNDLIVQNIRMKLCVPPCCYIGLCFRGKEFNKKRLRLMRGLVYQMPLAQFAIIILQLIMIDAEVIQRGVSTALSVFFSILNISCFVFGVWGCNIIITAFKKFVSWPRYKAKANVLMLFVGLMKTQNFILAILTDSGEIGCIQPNVTPFMMKRTIDATATLVESLIFGILFYLVYRNTVSESDSVEGDCVESVSEKERPVNSIDSDVTPNAGRRFEIGIVEETNV